MNHEAAAAEAGALDVQFNKVASRQNSGSEVTVEDKTLGKHSDYRHQ